MHEYTVELRIYGETLNPSAITSELGLQPSIVRRAGDSIGTKSYQYALWGYNGSKADDTPIRWKSLEDGLAFLLTKLDHLKSKVEQYKSQYKIIFWCGHFQSTFDGGPTLSSSMLKRLGDFGIELFIDNYFSIESSEEESSRASEP
jgi:hypothetical protein